MITREDIKTKSSEELINYIKSLPKSAASDFIMPNNVQRYYNIETLAWQRHQPDVLITIFEIAGYDAVDEALTDPFSNNLLNDIVQASTSHSADYVTKIVHYLLMHRPNHTREAMAYAAPGHASALYRLCYNKDYKRLEEWRQLLPISQFVIGIYLNHDIGISLDNLCEEDKRLDEIVSSANADYISAKNIDDKLKYNGKIFLTVIALHGTDSLVEIFKKANPVILKNILIVDIQFFLTNFIAEEVRSKVQMEYATYAIEFQMQYLTYAEQGHYAVAHALAFPNKPWLRDAEALQRILTSNDDIGIFAYLRGRHAQFKQQNLIYAFENFLHAKTLLKRNPDQYKELKSRILARVLLSLKHLGHEFLAEGNANYGCKSYSAAGIDLLECELNMAAANTKNGLIDVAAARYLDVCFEWFGNKEFIEPALEKFCSLDAQKSASPRIFKWMQNVFRGEGLIRKIPFYYSQKNTGEVVAKLKEIADKGSITAIKVLLRDIFYNTQAIPSNEEFLQAILYFQTMCALFREERSFDIPASMNMLKLYINRYLDVGDTNKYRNIFLDYLQKHIIDEEIKIKIAAVIVENIDVNPEELRILKEYNATAQRKWDDQFEIKVINTVSKAANSFMRFWSRTPTPNPSVSVEMVDRQSYITFDEYSNRNNLS